MKKPKTYYDPSAVHYRSQLDPTNPNAVLCGEPKPIKTTRDLWEVRCIMCEKYLAESGAYNKKAPVDIPA